jgi:hypothetical protein
MLTIHWTRFLLHRYADLLDCASPFLKLRWLGTMVLVAIYALRVYELSYSVLNYLIGFYLLQLLSRYIMQVVLPEGEAGQFEEPGSEMGEWRGIEEYEEEAEFQGNKAGIGELKVWELLTLVVLLGIVCTVFKSAGFDVYWALLMFNFATFVSSSLYSTARKMYKYSCSVCEFSNKSAALT